jgi:hypothetical protein
LIIPNFFNASKLCGHNSIEGREGLSAGKSILSLTMLAF